MKQGIATDKYYMKEESFKNDPFCDCQPLDMNGALVVEKQGNGMKMQSQEEVQLNIRERFGLCTKEDYSYKNSSGK